MEQNVPEAVLMVGEEISDDFRRTTADTPSDNGDGDSGTVITRILFLGLLAAGVTYVIIQGVKVVDEDRKDIGTREGKVLLVAITIATAFAIVFSFTGYRVWWWVMRWAVVVAAVCALLIFAVILANRIDSDDSTPGKSSRVQAILPANGGTQQVTHHLTGKGRVSMMVDCTNRVNFDGSGITIEVSSDGVNFHGGGGIVIESNADGRFFFNGILAYRHIKIQVVNNTPTQYNCTITISEV